MKTIVNYLIGEFVNYAGQKQQVVICAITSDPFCTHIAKLDDSGDRYNSMEAYRQLHLGISIQNPNDPVNVELGKKIAFGKALSNIPALVSTIPGVITKEVVDSLMTNTLKYVKNSPENFITTYAKNRDKYNKQVKLNEKFNNLSSEDKELVSKLNRSDLEELIEIASTLR